MLDIKFVRENPEVVQTALKNRGNSLTLDVFMELEKQRREILGKVEVLKGQRNTVSKQISVMKKNKENTDDIVAEMRRVGDEITELDAELREVETKLRDIMLNIPNIPDKSVPVGKDENDNPEVRRWGEPKTFAFEPKAHWDLGEDLQILDPERAAKVTGARFTFYKGLGARLERSVINVIQKCSHRLLPTRKA